jgi:hypothetical protein
MMIPWLLLLLVRGVLVLGLSGQTARPNAYSVTEIYYALTAPVLSDQAKPANKDHLKTGQ